MKNVPFGAYVLHTDTTNFSLHGKYGNFNPELKLIKITYGHPKDMGWDLKCFRLSIVCNQEGMPLFVETLSGIASNKKCIREDGQENIGWVESELNEFDSI